MENAVEEVGKTEWVEMEEGINKAIRIQNVLMSNVLADRDAKMELAYQGGGGQKGTFVTPIKI